MLYLTLLKQTVTGLAKVIIRAARARLASKAQANDWCGTASVTAAPNVNQLNLT
jgi:hypothetical protein